MLCFVSELAKLHDQVNMVNYKYGVNWLRFFFSTNKFLPLRRTVKLIILKMLSLQFL